jgi:hypothetical protein
VATSGEKKWPPVGKFVAAAGENLMAIDTREPLFECTCSPLDTAALTRQPNKEDVSKLTQGLDNGPAFIETSSSHVLQSLFSIIYLGFALVLLAQLGLIAGRLIPTTKNSLANRKARRSATGSN